MIPEIDENRKLILRGGIHTMNIKAVFFDVSETLVDETRDWSEWADYLGVSRFAFRDSRFTRLSGQ
ncbi:hypothetical protein CFB39_37365 [Burkholderia sp. AU6039]|nr:hypothetical protein CFB39_37365 [Burkholderia sp. AU6039]